MKGEKWLGKGVEKRFIVTDPLKREREVLGRRKRMVTGLVVEFWFRKPREKMG